MSISISGRPISRVRDLAGHAEQFNLAEFGVLPDGTDQVTRMTSLIAALPTGGCLIECAPGKYRFYSELDFNDIPSVKFQALAGKHFQGNGTTASPVQSGGVIFEAWTAGQKLIKFDRPSNTDATHQGPTFEGIGFQDGRVVASRRSVTAVANSSGNVFTYTINTAVLGNHTFVAGDTVFINGVQNAAAPFGTPFNGRFTVAASPAPTGTTFSADIGSAPSTAGLVFTSADVRYAPSATLADVEHETRSRFNNCSFSGGSVGLQMGSPIGSGQNDVSWSKMDGCSFQGNDIGILFTGDQSQSVTILGGDWQIAWGQIGVDFVGGKAMFKMRDFKMDTIYNDGTGVIGIRLQQATQYMIDGSFEMDGPAVNIALGDAGSASGRIACSFQGNNKGTKGSRVGKAVEIGIADANATGVTTNASANISLASFTVGNRHTYFDQTDVGKTITGTNIPASTTILSVTDSTHAVMSANATASGSAIAFAWSFLNGTTAANIDVSEVSMFGSTFVTQGICVDIGPSSRNVSIFGGSTTLCDVGANIQAGAANTTLVAFKRRRAESGGSDATFAANHIVDNGTNTQRLFCDNIVTPGGLVPVAGTTGMTDGFVYVPSAAGAPTAAPPTTYTGRVPMYFDSTNHKLYFYDGTWKGVTVA